MIMSSITDANNLVHEVNQNFPNNISWLGFWIVCSLPHNFGSAEWKTNFHEMMLVSNWIFFLGMRFGWGFERLLGKDIPVFG